MTAPHAPADDVATLAADWVQAVLAPRPLRLEEAVPLLSILAWIVLATATIMLLAGLPEARGCWKSRHEGPAADRPGLPGPAAAAVASFPMVGAMSAG